MNACADCAKPVGAASKRCRSCACKERNSRPEVRAKVAARLRACWADPIEREQRLHANIERVSRMAADPKHQERWSRLGLTSGIRNFERGRTPEVRAKAGPKISAAKTAHIHPSYRKLYRDLKRKGTAAERERLVLDQMAHDEATAALEVARSQREMELKHRRQIEEAY